ncbi:hypothetical protein SCYAM73S_04109 [Streptomyces cyaneofuscatus]
MRSVIGAGQVRGGDHAVAVGGVADPAERHGEAALGVGAAPVGGGPADALQLGGADVTCSPDPGLVAVAFDTPHHLAYVPHGPPGEGEIRDIDHRLVAQLQGGESGLAGPDLAAALAAPHHGRGPGVRLRLVHEAFDGAGPGLHVADGVAAGQHHPGDDPVADGGLAAGGEDDGLVAAECEVAERVAAAVRRQQRPQPALVVLGEAGGRVFGAEGEVDRGDGGQQAERAERVGDGPAGPPGVVDRALDAEQAVQHVLEPVRDGRVADDAAGVDGDDDQPERQRRGPEQYEVGQRPPAAARVGQGAELVPVADEQVAERQGDQDADDRVPVRELRHGPRRKQHHRRPPGPPLVPLQPVREQEQQHAGAQRERGGERTERAGEHLGEGVHPAVPEAGEDTGRDVDQSDDGAGGADDGRYGFGAGAVEQPPHALRNRHRFIPIYRDRHRFRGSR